MDLKYRQVLVEAILMQEGNAVERPRKKQLHISHVTQTLAVCDIARNECWLATVGHAPR